MLKLPNGYDVRFNDCFLGLEKASSSSIETAACLVNLFGLSPVIVLFRPLAEASTLVFLRLLIAVLFFGGDSKTVLDF